MHPNRKTAWQRAFGNGAILAGMAVLMMACASVPPPTAQMAVATTAVANAASAGGAEFAPAEMASAQRKLDRASVAMGREEYVVARQLADEAQADARLAEKMAQSAKARKAANVMQEDNRVLREEINRKSN